MNKKEYNGWTNYETWLVNLWMDNEEGSHRYWSVVAHDSIQEHKCDEEPENWYYFERVLKEFLDDIGEGDTGRLYGMAADLLNAAISEVDTRAIAQSWVANQVEVTA